MRNNKVIFIKLRKKKKRLMSRKEAQVEKATMEGGSIDMPL